MCEYVYRYVVDVFFVFFFFKQKTAYEMRISDWSSDVCSSDLARRAGGAVDREEQGDGEPEPGLGRGGGGDVDELVLDQRRGIGGHQLDDRLHVLRDGRRIRDQAVGHHHRAEQRHEREAGGEGDAGGQQRQRSETHRDGKEGDSTGRTRGGPEHKKKKKNIE